MQLKKILQEIVQKASTLKDACTNAPGAPVNYACVFSHTNDEFDQLLRQAHELGSVVEETPTGPLFQVVPIQTIAGNLQLVKIRKPDSKRPEQGDADFTVSDYSTFKNKYLQLAGFRLIQRSNFEMIELAKEGHEVLAYFSHPPLDEQLGLQIQPPSPK